MRYMWFTSCGKYETITRSRSNLYVHPRIRHQWSLFQDQFQHKMSCKLDPSIRSDLLFLMKLCVLSCMLQFDARFLLRRCQFKNIEFLCQHRFQTKCYCSCLKAITRCKNVKSKCYDKWLELYDWFHKQAIRNSWLICKFFDLQVLKWCQWCSFDLIWSDWWIPFHSYLLSKIRNRLECNIECHLFHQLPSFSHNSSSSWIHSVIKS